MIANAGRVHFYQTPNLYIQLIIKKPTVTRYCNCLTNRGWSTQIMESLQKRNCCSITNTSYGS